MILRPRIGAVIFLIVLLGGLAVTGVALTAWLGPISSHGTNVTHVAGDIITVGPGRDFEFKTDEGVQMDFVCATNCRASLRHLVRHVKEKAHTDVYYVHGTNNELLVVDVD